ncbi:MAG: LysM peptidoglycan-binding domain-containing protein [Bacteroidales bacterium]|nr:LysM peptidoglycan-binding domain-containing protein [Bacteroidales bacterium]
MPDQLNAQVLVERSKDKVIVAGEAYYIHNVKKGETAYSIARAYNVTVEELNSGNPAASSGLKEGQTLRIPVRPVTEKPQAAVPVPVQQRDESRFIYHKLNAGETVYSLSRIYSLTENEIIESNKGIDITKLPVGAEIAIPRKTQVTVKTDPVPPAVQKYQHKVERGETFSSIAEKYGLSIRELRRANRDIRFPQVGGFLVIPGMTQPVQPVKEPVITEIAAEEPAEEKPEELPVGFTEVSGLRGTLNVAVLLPFYIRENAQRYETDVSDKTKPKKRVIFRSEDWIYPRSVDFVELYQGILLAADTLRSLGIDINIHAFDVKSDTSELVRLLSSGRLAKMDLIIGPVYSHNLAKVAEYARYMGIPVISPVPLYNNSPLLGNPNLFLTSSANALELAQKKIASLAGEYNESNFIFIHSDTTGSDSDSYRFRSLLRTELASKMPEDQISFREMQFYSRSKFGNDSIGRLTQYMSDKSKNIVIIATEESPVISETMEAIHALSRKYDISVIGYPVMRDLDNLDPKYFFDLDVMLFYPFWIDYSGNNVKSFLKDYRNKFLTEPPERSFAWHGYDVAYYFMSGISMHGKKFLENPAVHNPRLLENYFRFTRTGSDNGFENQQLFLIRYSKDYEVKLITGSRP